MNNGGRTTCEICEEKAPESAWMDAPKTELEIQQDQEALQKVKEEEEK